MRREDDVGGAGERQRDWNEVDGEN